MTTRPSPDKRGGAALCCQCGNLRSNGPQMVTRDPNRTAGCVSDDPRGWRMTRTIYCPICEMPTCHAMLDSGHTRDRDEEFVYKRAHWWDHHGTAAP
jgi:hypothetical protein